ncbi:MAG: NUDIX domain-containing protein [Candidatus Aenigmarchaeota archaeon]|nr:NUDIX domain-containing protein [Candidatus Aenigmarchaeota archaeon]
MPHIHEKIDFTIAAYIVHKDKVLLIHHKELSKWLPIGGHIELNEDADEALFRKIKEECGLSEKDLTISDNRPRIRSKGTKFLLTPQYVDIHEIRGSHRHIVLIYFMSSKKDKIKLKEHEHNEIRWFDKTELKKTLMSPALRFYATEALKMLRSK